MFILGVPKVQIFKDGQFLVGGKVYTYAAGTSTPKATYPTWDNAVAETSANANPVVLDARGEANIVLKGATKITVADADDNTLWSIDDLDTSNIDIIGVDGGALLTFTGVANAVNHFQISNSAQGDEIVFEVVGDDTNINLEIRCKGTENFRVVSSDMEITAGNLVITSGNLELTSGNIVASSGTVNLTDGSMNLGNNPVGFTFLPAGTMMWHGGSTAPTGWLECDGSAISRTTYENLFDNIGTAFGVGNGTTTFNLPAQARRTLVGKGGSGTGTLGSSIGSTGGSETHTLSETELPAHTHTYTLRDTFVSNPAFGLVAGTATNHGGALTSASDTTSNAGTGNSHNIMQPSLVAMLIIRAY